MARPLYQVIADDLRLTVGELSAGQRLAPERELARHYEVSHDTIRDALALLEAEGLLDRRRGRGGGTFVRRRPRRVRERVGEGDGPRAVITTAELRPPPAVAEALGLEPDQRALLRRRVIEGLGKVGEAWYPADLVRLTPIARPAPTGKRIRLIFTQDLGLLLAPSEEYVSTRMPAPAEAAELGLGPGVPLLVTNHDLVTVDGRVVMSDTVIRDGSRYVLTIPGT